MSNYLFFIGRYAAYFFMGAEIIMLPFLISDKTVYGNMEYFKAFLSLMPLLLMGFHSGYLRSYYVEKKDLTNSLLVGGGILLFPLAVGSALYFKNIVLFFACMSSGLSIFLEKIYQRKEKFLLAILFKPLISTFNILLLYFLFKVFKLGDSLNVLTIVSLSYIISITIFSLPQISELNFRIDFTQLKVDIQKLILNGFWLNLGTICVNLFLFLDRSFLKENDANALSDYSFAYNISQVLFVFFTSISYINEVKFGESINKFSALIFWKVLSRLFTYLLIGILVIGTGYYILLYFFPQFSQGDKFFFVLAPSWGLFFTTGALGVVAQYMGLQRRMSLFLLVITLFNLILFVICQYSKIQISPILWISKSGILIVIYSLYLLWSIRRNIAENEN